MSERASWRKFRARILVGSICAALAAGMMLGPAPALGHGVVPDLGRPVYTEVTQEAGLGAFLHAGFLGDFDAGLDPFFTEFIGPGACWIDYNLDGRLDLYLVNNLFLTEPAKNALLNPRSLMFRNEADATFLDVGDATGTALVGMHMGCAAADYDDDADPDLFVTGWNGSVLLENQGDGTFLDATEEAGVRDEACGDAACWASSASWLDYNRDGCLDLYVDHFGDYDPANPVFPVPSNAPPQKNRLFRSTCDGAFEDVTDAAGLLDEGHSWSSVAADYNNDGWPDVYVSNDGDDNDLYLNNGDGTFTRKADTVADNDGRSGMGTAVGDFNHDNRLDIVTTNFVHELNGVYRADGDDYVSLDGTEPFKTSDPWNGWATHWFDINNDAQPDLMAVNGMTFDTSVTALDHEMLAYENLDGSTFRELRDDLGPDFARSFCARGAAWADYDNDGDVDFQLGEAGERPTHLFRADGTGGNFLNLDLVGTAPTVTRDAAGARVTVRAPGVPDQHQEKILGSGFLGSNDPRLHVGLARAEAADVTVRWPDGSEETWTDLRANSFVRLEQGQATPTVLRELPIVRIHGPTTTARLSGTTFQADAFVALGEDLASIAWNFEDGGVASGSSVEHAFADVGWFVVRATVTDTAGLSKTQALRVLVEDALTAGIQLGQATYLPTDAVDGFATVLFSNGDPVAGASVRLSIRHSTGQAGLDAVLDALKPIAPQRDDPRDQLVEGVTDGEGRFAFTIPPNVPGFPAPAAHAPGSYTITATGGARESVFPPTIATFAVV